MNKKELKKYDTWQLLQDIEHLFIVFDDDKKKYIPITKEEKIKLHAKLLSKVDILKQKALWEINRKGN